MPTAEAASSRPHDRRIGDALVRLNRAVQRASIYPPGHPAIPAAVKSVAESLARVFAERPVLLVGVTSDRLVVEGLSLEERRPALGWLTMQLRDRGLASMSFERGLPEPELVRFVEWLARPLPEAEVGGEPIRFVGIALTRYDYSKARFGDARSSAPQDPDRLWHALASSLTAGWYVDENPLVEEPEALARELSAYVLRNEGIGAAALLARIEATGAHLPHLPDAARAALKLRLSAFVAGLTPDLRTQLLRVDKGTSRQKADLLADVMDGLPDSLVMEILADLDLDGAPPPRHLLNLFGKLIGLAAKDPLSRELAEAKLPSMGLPAGLTALEPEKITAALHEVFDARGDYVNPEGHQQRLEDLSEAGPTGSARYESRHYEDPRDPTDVHARASSVVLRLLVARPEGAEVPGYLRRLLADLPGDVAGSRFDLIYDRATALRDLLSRPTGLSDVARPTAADYLAHLAEPGLVAALLRAAERSAGPPSPGLVGLLRGGGVEAACAAFDHLAAMPPDDESHERVAELLFLLEPETFKAAVARLRSIGSPSLRALIPLLRHPAAPLGPELLLTFLGNKDPAIRLETFRLLLAGDPLFAQFQRLMAKALADSDPEVARLGIERAQAAGGASSAKMLSDLLADWLRGRTEPELGKRAIAALAAFAGPHGRDSLVRLLQGRKIALGVAAVRRSMALEAGLLRVGDEVSVAAVQSFRRSPAGWLSMLLPEEEVPSP